MTEEVKKIFSGSEVGILIEDFERKVDIVAEGVLSLDQKFDRTAAELKDFIRSEIGTLRIEIKAVQESKADAVRVDALDQRVAALERLVGKRAA